MPPAGSGAGTRGVPGGATAVLAELQARRLLGGREAVTRRPPARGRAGFPAPGDRFHAVGTPRPAAPVAGWPPSNGRAATEHRRQELPHAFGAAGFCSRRFWATAAALRRLGVLSTLRAACQPALAAPVRRPFATLRTPVVACGALLGQAGRPCVLRLSRPVPWPPRFLAHLQRLLPWVPPCDALGDPPVGAVVPGAPLQWLG